MRTTALLILPFALLAADTRAAQPNMIRNGDFEEEPLDGWQPGENVSIEATTEKVHSGNRSIKLTWHDVTEMPWGRGGNLCGAQEIIKQNLKEDTRYRVKCSILVDEFQVAAESRKWLAEEPPGKYDPPTVTIGCFGGYWTSRMPWVAYDIGKLGTWQEMELEFTTPIRSPGTCPSHSVSASCCPTRRSGRETSRTEERALPRARGSCPISCILHAVRN